MAQKNPHLDLPKFDNFEKKKRKFFGPEKADRDPEVFYNAQIRNLDLMRDSYNKDRKKLDKFFNPNLIFKIKLTGTNVSDKFLRDELKQAGITTISSAHSKQGYWVAFNDDADFEKFRQKLKTHISKDKVTFIDLIDGIEEIPSDEKFGESLKEKSILKGKPEYLDVEIWKMNDEKLENFISGLSKMIWKSDGDISDRLVTDNFCIMRIKCDDKLFMEIIKLREISHIDRPPQAVLNDKLDADIADVDPIDPPDENSPGILIADSGIMKHPLIENAIADTIAIPSSDGRIKKDRDVDDVGHGTGVAGIALYGDVKRCIDAGEFVPQIWMYSAKIMYRGDDDRAVYDEKSLLEHQLKDAVEKTIEKHPRCKIINISFGNSAEKMISGQRQLRIASLIDELSVKHPDILFTIASGNNTDDVGEHESYPNYLIDGNQRVKITDPATSVHGISVGSVFSFNSKKSNNLNFPSPFTRVGPGLGGMIKPELVDSGGGYAQDLITVNPRWVSEGRLFTMVNGTSYSAPKIAHYLAKIKYSFPTKSRNFLKTLLLSSAVIPPDRPKPLNNITFSMNDTDLQNLLNVYGYGKPNLDYALSSESNRVLLTHDGKVEPNRVDLFTVNLPEDFILVKGRRAIEVTLAFDPPTNRNRADYMGITMEYHLFRNSSVKNIKTAYAGIRGESETDVPDEIKNKEIKMSPGVNLRKKGAHQKSIKEYRIKPRIDTSTPLVLAVVCQKKWFDKTDYLQSYSVIVTFRHEQEIDLYNKIRLRNRPRERV